jgi:hypothetical protein
VRIERLWVEVGSQFARRWRAFFLRLERLHCLDVSNPAHLWLLHTLFLDAINDDCKGFQGDWNAHPISGSGSPEVSISVFLLYFQMMDFLQDLRFLGQLKHGIYENGHKGIHSDTLTRYGNQMQSSETGPDQEYEIDEEIVQGINREQQHHIRHEGIGVPRHHNPFTDKKEETQFFEVFAKVVEEDIEPVGYGLHSDEWENGEYPLLEFIKVGKRAAKQIQVSLEDPLWKSRAVLWVQGLNVLSYFRE